MKHKPRSKAEIIADIKYAKQNKDTLTGNKIGEMIDILILLDAYEWDKSEIKVFHEMKAKYFAEYLSGRMTAEDIKAQVERIKTEVGIDVLEPVMIGKEQEV